MENSIKQPHYHCVSIIVPIYNTEKYLRQCLESIIAQTYTLWEAILIDDGSPDNCGKICDEYATKDKRFKVIHQENCGVSIARQKGLDNANGDYIIHCDPDDWIEPTMLMELLNTAVNKKADMVICDYIIEKNQGAKYAKQYIPENSDSNYVIENLIGGSLHGSLCNKLIRRDCCSNIKFYPSNIYLAEDELFNIRVLKNDISIAYLPKAFYHYRMDNSSSICNSKNGSIIKSRILTLNEYEKILGKEFYDNFFIIKKDILTTLFITGNIKGLDHIFKDINKRIIDQYPKYDPRLPLGYFLSLALKGFPFTAYCLFKINMKLIHIIKQAKKQLHIK